MPKLIVVIAAQRHHPGNGTVDDPFRMITTYHTPQGDLLAEVDPFIVSQGEKLKEERDALASSVWFFQEVRDQLQRSMARPVSQDPKEVWPLVRDLIKIVSGCE